jgi:hypothetical protein
MKIQTATELKMMFEALRHEIEQKLERVDRIMSELIKQDDEN